MTKEIVGILQEKYSKNNLCRQKAYSARQRCNNSNNPGYKKYGAKGIKFLMTVEEIEFLWLRDNALQMECPSIDRIDSKGNYELANCRIIENSLNRYLGAISQNKAKTHCKHGHEFTVDNTYIRSNGSRNCRYCRAIVIKNYRNKLMREYK